MTWAFQTFAAVLFISLWMPMGLAAPTADAAGDSLGGDFTLTADNGEPYSLDEARGQVVLLFFGFTHCPDVCPNTLANINAVMAQLGEQAKQVRPLFISVDPARDTPKVLKEYVQYFNPRVIGLTGSRRQIDRVADQYHAHYSLGDTSQANYDVDHTASLYIIDTHGELARIVPYGMPSSEILRTVKRLLRPTQAS